MPIVVRHEPDPALLADIGYTIGQGMQSQYQEEMAQRERMQSRAIQANLLSQRIAQDEAAFRQANALGADVMRQQLGFGQADKLQEMRHRNMLELQDARDADQREQMEFEWNMRRENSILGGLAGVQRDMGKGMLDFVNRQTAMIGQMMAKGYQFSPDQQAKINTTMQQVNELYEVASNDEDHRLPAINAAASLMRGLMPAIQGAAPSPQEQAQQDVAEATFPDGRRMKLIRKGEDWVQAKEENTAEAEAKTRLDYQKLAVQALTAGDMTEAITPEQINEYVDKLMGKGSKPAATTKPLNAPGQPVAKPKGNFEGMLEIPDPAAAALMGAQ